MTRSGSNPKPLDAQAPGTVKVQKRAPAPAPSETREKACATCGRSFQLKPDEKFFLCPACYKKAYQQPKKRKTGATVLNRIHCSACGAEEYLSFVPTDPAEALCKACFAKLKREQRSALHHTPRS